MGTAADPGLAALDEKLGSARRDHAAAKRLDAELDEIQPRLLAELGRRRKTPESRARADSLEREVAGLKRRREALGDTRATLRRLVREKESLLLRGGGKAAEMLRGLSEGKRDLIRERDEIRTARSRAGIAARALRHVIRALADHARGVRPDGEDEMPPLEKARRQAERAVSCLQELEAALDALEGEFPGSTFGLYPGLPGWALDRGDMKTYIAEAQGARRRLDSLLADLDLHLGKVEDDLREVERARRGLILDVGAGPTPPPPRGPPRRTGASRRRP